ncbi:MAG: shikimate kinase [Acutalibacteraceae bacterium]|nr:shikimate kinase [Acutalibacteraceae bacterium]MEE3312167.1 shikimate kinase [Acutalibacteraceae bacterium]
MKDNIILIGMPGCGKSTIGVLLAKNLAYGFLDSDLVIQEQSGRKLQDMIDEMGPEAFSAFEDAVNATLIPHNTVIATGGSAVYGTRAMEHFKQIGTVVYLKASYETIEKRIRNFATRGIVIPEGQTFRDVYNERTALYEKYADITVDVDTVAAHGSDKTGKTDIWDVVEAITAKLKD